MNIENQTDTEIKAELERLQRRVQYLERLVQETNPPAVQQAFLQKEREIRTIIENSPDAIVRYSPELRIVYVNPALEKIWRQPAANMVGRKLAEVDNVSPERAEWWNEKFRRTFETGQNQFVEYSQQMPNGEPKYYQTSIVPEYSPGGEQVESILAISRDITALKITEKELEAEKERLSVTLSSIGEAVIATDRQGLIRQCNQPAAILLGLAREEIIGQSLAQVMSLREDKKHAPFAVEKLIQQTLEAGEPLKFGLAPQRLLLRDAAQGQERPVEGQAGPIRGQDKQVLGVVLVFEDVSQRRRMEEELQKADKLASIGVLAGGIAHDFNNFLTGILGNLSLIRHALPTEAQQPIQKNLRDAENACHKARSLTQQLLTFAKGGTPVKQNVAVGQLLEESACFVLSGSPSRVSFQIAPDLWHTEIDEGQISQVIQNLVINAHQAMPGGGNLTLRAENVLVDQEGRLTEYSADGESPKPIYHNLPLPAGSYIRVTVADEGIGIPATYLANIFDPYFTTKQGGTGLGLAVCYSIIKNHDGFITVESEPGVGTTFYIFLPALRESRILPASKVAQMPVQSAPVSLAPPKRILAMDDQEIILELFKDTFAFGNYEVECATDGETAIEIFKKAKAAGQPFDLVIVDLTVPGKMGGRETTVRLLEIEPTAKVIVSSGYSNDPITSNYRAYGFKAAVPKPFDIDELLAVAEKVIAGN